MVVGSEDYLMAIGSTLHAVLEEVAFILKKNTGGRRPIGHWMAAPGAQADGPIGNWIDESSAALASWAQWRVGPSGFGGQVLEDVW